MNQNPTKLRSALCCVMSMDSILSTYFHYGCKRLQLKTERTRTLCVSVSGGEEVDSTVLFLCFFLQVDFQSLLLPLRSMQSLGPFKTSLPHQFWLKQRERRGMSFNEVTSVCVCVCAAVSELLVRYGSAGLLLHFQKLGIPAEEEMKLLS